MIDNNDVTRRNYMLSMVTMSLTTFYLKVERMMERNKANYLCRVLKVDEEVYEEEDDEEEGKQKKKNYSRKV